MAYLTCELYSEALRMPTSVAVILPHDITHESRPARVLYLLHGRSHNYSVWQRYTSLERYCQAYHAAVIMPEVNRSFYSDMELGVNYFTYISQELPQLCESMFGISSDPGDRFIAGMSMGGYGCLKTALTNPSAYAACAAISAVTDIRLHVRETPADSPKGHEFRAIFGPDASIPETADLYELSRRALREVNPPKFHFLCGTEDHLYQEGRLFCEHLRSLGYETDWQEWAGAHTWDFWDTAIERVLKLFFD